MSRVSEQQIRLESLHHVFVLEHFPPVDFIEQLRPQNQREIRLRLSVLTARQEHSSIGPEGRQQNGQTVR